MSKQVSIQEILNAFKGMFPFEIVQVLNSHEKFFGFKIEKNRTRFLLNSFKSENLYTKVPIDRELRQLAEKFLAHKICVYDGQEIPSTLASKITSEPQTIQSFGELAIPRWLNPTTTLNVIEDMEDLYWLWRYKKSCYKWVLFDCKNRCVQVLEDPHRFQEQLVHVCEFKHTMSVINTLISEGKFEKPVDPEAK